MANINLDVSVSVGVGAPQVRRTGFGIPLWIAPAGTLGVGFTERIRFYAEDEAADDDDLSAQAQAAVAAVFAQDRSVDLVAVGRVEADQAQVITFTFSGTPEVGDEMIVTINGVETSYTVASTTLNDEVDALRSAMVTALSGEDVTVAGTSPDITVTADTAGDPFTYTSEIVLTGSGDLAVAEAETTADRSISTELDEIMAESSNFYGVEAGSKDDTDITRLAAKVESMGLLHLAQVDNAAVKAGTSGNLLETLAGLNYGGTALIWHNDDDEELALAWMGYVLEADPDEKSTNWKHRNLAGITSDTDNLSSTEILNIRNGNGNVYTDFYGVAVTANGVTVDGNPIDFRITRDWLRARIEENVAQRLLEVAAANSKIPYTDAGLQQMRAIVQKVLQNGVDAGHLRGNAENADGELTPRATVPALADVPGVDRSNRICRVEFEAELAGAIESVTISGTVAIDLTP